jgi:hypothetical protein
MRRNLAVLPAALLAIFLVIFLLGALPAAAQSILPSSFAGWSIRSKGPFNPADAEIISHPAVALAGPATIVAKEYGFVSGENALYANGQDSIYVEVYRMKDPSGAYGEYSFLRTRDMPSGNLTEHSTMSDDRALVLTGNLILDIQGKGLPKLQPDLKALIAAVAPLAQMGPLPTLTDHLPRTDFVDRSDRYVLGPAALNQLFPVALGNSLGFTEGAEAELAHYRVGRRELTLLIVDFPTPQTAAKKLAELQQAFHVVTVGDAKSDSKPNGDSAALYARRSLTLLAFVAGASSKDEASVLLRQVDSGTELTWNEPTFQFTQPSIGSMIVGTIIGTGVICMFALVSGLAFGGVRLVVKRALPNRVFDRSDQLQILQLGLASKPINAQDFYGIGSADKN